MRKPKFIVHIGYPKTGTTTLQVNVFSVLHGEGRINFLGNSEMSGIAEVVARDRYIRQILFKNFRERDILTDLGSGALNGFLISDKINIFSSEYFCIPHATDFNISEMPKRLILAFGSNVDYEVVLTLREPNSLIRSYYAHFFEGSQFFRCQYPSQDDFIFDLLRAGSNTNYSFNFWEVIKGFESWLPRKNIHINFFEDIVQNTRDFEIFWGNLVGINISEFRERFNAQKAMRKRLSQKGYTVIVPRSIGNSLGKFAIPNRAAKILLNKLPKRIIKLPDITSETRALVTEHFRKDIKRLEVRYNLSAEKLYQYGYYERAESKISTG